MGFLRHPQQFWIRRANFQIHLWCGIVLALYAFIIGVSGSILVFGAEIGRFENPSPWPVLPPGKTIAGISMVIDRLSASYPHTHVVSIMAPTANEAVFIATLQSTRRFTVACHPFTGQVLREIHAYPAKLDFVYDLHENLLGGRTGRVINGVCACALLLVAITGLVNWWPGIQRWRRALLVDFRRSWRRVNFDLHSAVGFWTFCFLVVWTTTGIYFTWPDKVFALVDRLSPIVNSRPPAISVNRESDIVKLDFESLMVKARSIDPGAQFKGLVFPSTRRSPFEVLLSRSAGVGRDYEDTLYFNAYNGQYISMWQYGVNKSLGDWLMWLPAPLHFGTHWGFASKCLWATAGLALPVLAVTGLVMYWNRYMRRRWRQSRKASCAT